MADEKKTPAKANPSGGEKFVNFFKQLPSKIAKPFKDMWHELKRVTWPTKRKLMIYSIIVLVFMLCMGVIIGLFDLGASALVKALGNIVS
ncbi:MAG: preprotein translocase subunit SecE [Clostridia bacterium]|jgi:preprotein translocase subunit SecE|nr:preprotein translocase subunit SecE [Clostridia bacterium]